MGIKLAAASGGSIELVPTNTASNYTVTVPAGTGTMVVSGASSAITSGTAVASTSGTSIDFTSIPSWVKRVTVMLSGVSTSGASNLQVQLGAGSVDTASYSSMVTLVSLTNNTTRGVAFTAGLGLTQGWGASETLFGSLIISLVGSNVWVCSGTTYQPVSINTNTSAGGKTLSGTLDRVRITTVNGTDTFDAGSINILYE